LPRAASRRNHAANRRSYDRLRRKVEPVAFPHDGRKFQPGNHGKPRGAAPVSRRRARKLVVNAIVAAAASPRCADFEGNSVDYLRACYSGAIVPDQLRMSAAIAAARFEVPSLSASVTRSLDQPAGTMIHVITGVPRAFDSDIDGGFFIAPGDGDVATAQQVTRLLRDRPEVAQLVLAQLADPDGAP
jgi:hypothetical protein